MNMARTPSDTTYTSPLRVHLLDAQSLRCLRDYLQARLVSYHEDENGQPTFPPDQRRQPKAPTSGGRVAASAAAKALRRPVRGLVTLRSCPDASAQQGMGALLEISANGDLKLWGGADFEVELINVELHKLTVSFSEDPARSDMFVLSVAQSVNAPAVCCFVKDRSKWLTIFARRGVTPVISEEADA
jgi:hypothetical protein